jgi:hypothetical protein
MRQLQPMAAVLRVAPLLALLVLPACSQLAPVEAAPAATGDAEANSVGVCYSRVASTPAQIADAAARECLPGTTPRLVGQDFNMSLCPVLTPIRATFACVAAKDEHQK